MSIRERAVVPRPSQSPAMSMRCAGARVCSCSMRNPAATGRVRTTALPRRASPKRRSAISNCMGGIADGSMSGPLSPAGSAGFPPASPVPRQCTRSKRPAIVALSAAGTSSDPASAGPLTSTAVPDTAVPDAAGATCSRACGKRAPSRCSCAAVTSMRWSARPSPAV